MKEPIYIVRSQEDGNYLVEKGLIEDWFSDSFNVRTKAHNCSFLYVAHRQGFMQSDAHGYQYYKNLDYTTFLEPYEYREDLRSKDSAWYFDADSIQRSINDSIKNYTCSPVWDSVGTPSIATKPIDDDDLTLSELAEKLRPIRDTYVPYIDRVALERKETEEKLIAEVRRGGK